MQELCCSCADLVVQTYLKHLTLYSEVQSYKWTIKYFQQFLQIPEYFFRTQSLYGCPTLCFYMKYNYFTLSNSLHPDLCRDTDTGYLELQNHWQFKGREKFVILCVTHNQVIKKTVHHCRYRIVFFRVGVIFLYLGNGYMRPMQRGEF